MVVRYSFGSWHNLFLEVCVMSSTIPEPQKPKTYIEYKGKKIGECSWGYHVGLRHFSSVEVAKVFIEAQS